MRVAIIASEVVPFSKTGGLADVAGALPGALARLGVDVTVVSPLYRSVRKHPLEQVPNLLTVPLGGGTAWGAVRRAGRFHFLEHDGFFDRDGLYADRYGDFGDNVARFVFLMRGALEYLSQIGKPPDIVHAHDWQTALVPLYLKTFYAHAFPRTKSVFTIHNLAYQGQFWKGLLPVTGFGWHRFTVKELECYDGLNFMKGGLVHADAITTVSPTYADEIRRPEYGWGMDGLLRDRGPALRGILNGIDEEEWNPETDALLPARFSRGSLAGKAACKDALQRRSGLAPRTDVPLFAMVTRLAEQKGVDLFLRCADSILRDDVQFSFLGSGDPGMQQAMSWLAQRYPGKVSVQFNFDNGLAHLIQAGSDFLIVPSRYEPCGLTQMYALRYGTIPIVRSTGGLVDTVEPNVTGIRFDHPNPEGLEWALREGIALYRDRPRCQRMQAEGMKRDFSWASSAREYLRLYESLLGPRPGN